MAGISVVAVMAGLGAAWGLGAFDGDTLAKNPLQDGVSQVLEESYQSDQK
ncbi:hypothetical protein [Amycolatopsis sulphurea]